MDLMVPTLDDVDPQSTGCFTLALGDLPTLTLTQLMNMHPYDAPGGKWSALPRPDAAPVRSYSSWADFDNMPLQQTADVAPVRSYSDLPDISNDYIVPDVMDSEPASALEGLTAGGQEVQSAIPRQQSYPMTDSNAYRGIGAMEGIMLAPELEPTELSAYSGSFLANAQLDARIAAAAAAAAVSRLAPKQDSIFNLLATSRRHCLAASTFMGSESEESDIPCPAASGEEELRMELLTGDESHCYPAPSVARRSRRSRSRGMVPPASPPSPSSSSSANSRRMVAQWPDRVLDLGTKALNQYLKNATLTDAEVNELKRERRRKKNRKYAMTSRQKRRVAGGAGSPSENEEEPVSEGVFEEMLVPRSA